MKTTNSLLSPIIAAIAVLAGGFLLFNLAFVLYALLISLPSLLSGQTENWVGSALPAMLVSGGLAIVLGLLVWYVVEKKLRKSTILAMLLTVPLMAILVFLGIGMYGQPDWLIGLVGALFILPILGYCVWKKVPWVYTLAVVYVAILGGIIMVFDVQI